MSGGRNFRRSEMKKLMMSLAALSLLVTACPNPETGKVDPYLTARTVILQAQTAISLADGIFHQWLLGQEADKAKAAEARYYKIKTAVVNGLKLAMDGVDIAEKAKKDPDVATLLAAADKAWQDLQKFLSDLLSKPTTNLVKAAKTGDLKKYMKNLPVHL
jgi:hypothetical protein